MDKEKLEIPLELDAAILQYAANKRFPESRRHFSWVFKIAALFIAVSVFGIVQFSADKEETMQLSSAGTEEVDWENFEEKMEYLDEEIFFEAKYLAQL